MIPMRSWVLSSAAACLLMAPAASNAEDGKPQSNSQFFLAQAEIEPPVLIEPQAVLPPELEPELELDPVAAAKKAVEDARAALRHERATGGDIRGARRNLKAVVEILKNVKEDAKNKSEETEAAEAAPTETPQAELPSPALPEVSSPQLPELATPKTPTIELVEPTAPKVPEVELPVLAQPEEPAEPEEAKRPKRAAKGKKRTLPIFEELPPVAGPEVLTAETEADEAVVLEKKDKKRVIVRKDGQTIIKHDDNDRFRRKGENIKVENGKNGRTITTVTRRNGTEIVTVRDASGDILQRYRKKRNGKVEILIGDRERDGRPRRARGGASPKPNKRLDFAKSLPRLVVRIPQRDYIVGSRGASRSQLERALIAPPVEAIERPYSLVEIRRSERLRAKLRRIDVDTVTFEFGAATIAEDQIANLQAIGNALASIVASNPNEVFLIEGHTDAVGSNLSNLKLSDQRAESIAGILTFYFDIPPENLITQGYGEQYLKVLTAGPERANRRAGVRRITPLLVGGL